MLKNALLFMLICMLSLPVSAEIVPEEAVLFESFTSASAANTNLLFVFTAHVGGDWDAAQMNEGSAFQVTYTGPENAVYLALSSYSGATQWARVNAAEIVDNEDGSHIATFVWPDIVKAWGTNFARLDLVSVFSATDEATTVTRVAYLPGEGAPVDASDGRWATPDTGIAFIGDSICQNVQGLGDWNTLLGRKDCVNYGIGAQTTVHCLARIGELCGRDYDQVVFICGINELGRSDYATGIAANDAAMIRALRESNPETQAVLVSVLPTTEAFYHGMQDRIVTVNASLAALAEEMENVTFVDCYSDFLDPERGYAKPELLSDGLHPNAEGYAVIVERLAPALVPEKE